MQFFNGTTDNETAQALSQINWQIRYNLLAGECQNNALFRKVIGKGKVEGSFSIKSSPISGEQATTIDWYVDEDRVKFSIKSITEAE